MTSPELERLVQIGTLKRGPGAQAEIDGLVRSARSRLTDAGRPALALESRFDLAYNAAHALALAALRWLGYRSENRYIGDANGGDRAVQAYLAERGYRSVAATDERGFELRISRMPRWLATPSAASCFGTGRARALFSTSGASWVSQLCAVLLRRSSGM